MPEDDDEKILRSRWIDHGPPRDPNLPSPVYDAQREFEAARRRTDPHTQQNPERKTLEAWRALVHATQEVDLEAGWALDHIVGLSLAGLKMRFIPPVNVREHPEYVAFLRAADTHEHEITGSRTYEEKPKEPQIRRLILRNLVFSKACAIPDWLRAELLEALDALDAGTVMPLLEKERRHGTEIIEARARLRLVTFVKFRSQAYATSQEQVRAEIAAMADLDAEALKSWELRFKDSCLDPIEVASEIRFARNAADGVRFLAQHRETGEISEAEIRIIEEHAREWNAAALDKAIADWKRARRRQHLN